MTPKNSGVSLCARFHARRAVSLGLLVSVAFGAQTAFSWGPVAHEIVNSAATQVMTSGERAFFVANLTNITTLANTPDNAWKSGPSATSEKPLHFMDWDVLAATPLANAMPINYEGAKKIMGDSFVAADGGGVWRVGQLFTKLVTAIKAHDCVTEIQIAGVLGHYVADMSNPMHFTSDYDGQSIGKPGVHAYFETKLIARMDRKTLLAEVAQEASQAHPELTVGKPSGTEVDAIAISFQEGKKAFETMPELMRIFKAGGPAQNDVQDPKLEALEAPLMGLGSAAVAHIWDLAAEYAGAGSGCPARAVTAPIPAWIAF